MYILNFKKHSYSALVFSIVLMIALALVLLIFNPTKVHAATITVTNTNDSGAGSLRQAITDANTSVGVADTIEFAIGSGQQSIAPTTPLPFITDTLTIDGTTQPGGATCGTNFIDRNLLIEINGPVTALIRY